MRSRRRWAIVAAVPAVLLAGPAVGRSGGADPGRTPSFGAPALKWQRGGCFGSWCQTGWYSSPAVADLNGDGQPDVVWGSYDVVSLNGSTGAEQWRAPSGNRVWPGVAVADLTGDGTLEVIVGAAATRSRSTTGSAASVWTANPFGNGEVRTLAVADLEIDGQFEIVVGRASGGATQQLNVFDARREPCAPGWPAPHDGEPGYGWGMYNENVAVADLNVDGLQRGHRPHRHALHHRARPRRQPAPREPGLHGPPGPKFWAEVGVHVDHLVDLAATRTAGWSTGPNFAEQRPAIADVNGDGVPEIDRRRQRLQLRHQPLHRPLLHAVHPEPATARAGAAAGSTGRRSRRPARTARRSGRGLQRHRERPAQPGGRRPRRRRASRRSCSRPTTARLHAYWLDKTEHGSWPYEVPAPAPATVRFAGEPVVADLDNDGAAEVLFTSWPQEGRARDPVGQLHVLSSLGVQLFAIDLPASFGGDWNGGLGAPTLANIDADPDLELVAGTPRSAAWSPTTCRTPRARGSSGGPGRGGYRRAGVPDPPVSLATSDCSVTRRRRGTGAVHVHGVALRRHRPDGERRLRHRGRHRGRRPGLRRPVRARSPSPPARPRRTLSVPVIGDLLDEPNEAFTLNLSSPVNATIADGQGIGTIVDNDPPPAVSVGDCAVVEGDAGPVPCAFTVSLSAPSSFTVSVSYATADGTATAPIDYTPAAGTLTFTPGHDQPARARRRCWATSPSSRTRPSS